MKGANIMGKINCPQCENLIDDTVMKCPYCNFDKISSYLLQLERKKEENYIDYTSFHNEIPVEFDENENFPKCPTCGSLNVKKISAVSKVAGASMFGLFSKTSRSQFCCRNCGYKW